MLYTSFAEVDYIYTIVDGRIAEQMAYNALMNARGAFTSQIPQFVTQDTAEEKEVKEEDGVVETPTDADKEKEKKKKREAAVKGALQHLSDNSEQWKG